MSWNILGAPFMRSERLIVLHGKFALAASPGLSCVMADPNLPTEIKAQLTHTESPVTVLGGVAGDIASDFAGSLLDLTADVAKEELCRRHGLDPHAMDDQPQPPLNRDSIPQGSPFAQARTLKELGIPEDAVPLTFSEIEQGSKPR